MTMLASNFPKQAIQVQHQPTIPGLDHLGQKLMGNQYTNYFAHPAQSNQAMQQNPVQQTGNQAWVGSQPMQQSNPMNANVLLNNTPNRNTAFIMNNNSPTAMNQSQPMNQVQGLLGNFGVNQVQNQMLNPVMQGSGKYGGQRSQKGANIPPSMQRNY